MISTIKRIRLSKYQNISKYLFKVQTEYSQDLLEESSEDNLIETQKCINEKCDFLSFEIPNRNFLIEELIIGSKFKNLSHFLKDFPLMFSDLFGNSKMYFFLELKNSWKIKYSDYELLSNAINGLENIVPEINNNDVIIASNKEILDFITINFWFSRCAPSLSRILFATENDDFIGHICKHGNIHLYYYSQLFIDNLSNKLNQKGWEILPHYNETDCFSN